MASLALARLTTRKLFRISGPDTYAYLQGLICNDLRHLYEKERIPRRKHVALNTNVLSTYMLNPQGRAICDMLIYRSPATRDVCKFSPPGVETENDELLIECDSELATGIANTLYGYRVRRKISIKMENDIHPWCLYPKFIDSKSSNEPVLEAIDVKDETQLQVADRMKNCNEIVSDNLIVVNDPRLTMLGMRILTTMTNFEDIKTSLNSIIDIDITKASISDYILHRYYLGVGEGSKDIIESACLPLECNADLLNSVSFQKGCYLGQELTARIHYTGVIRKRLMPIMLINHEKKEFPLQAGNEIIDRTKKKKIGLVRSLYKNRGLGLIRTDLLPETMDVWVEGSECHLRTYIPYWWSELTEK